MAAGTDAIIMSLLLDRLALMTPALPIALPGIPFPAGGAIKPDSYLQATFVPNRTVTRTVGPGRQQHIGIIQISVWEKAGRGQVKPLETAGRIISHFAKGTSLEGQGVRVKIDRKPWAAPPLQDAAYVQVPVTVEYVSFNA
jgi:hypothetical protein